MASPRPLVQDVRGLALRRQHASLAGEVSGPRLVVSGDETYAEGQAGQVTDRSNQLLLYDGIDSRLR